MMLIVCTASTPDVTPERQLLTNKHSIILVCFIVMFLLCKHVRLTCVFNKLMMMITDYLAVISGQEFCPEDLTLQQAWQQYPLLRSLFSHVYCIPATSAPVERVFFRSGIIIRPHRVRMSDSLLEKLVFLQCNAPRK